MSAHPNLLLSIHKDRVGRVGEERIRLLEAVRDHGSISAAARATGVTYKTAWDGIDALNNLFDRPLVTTQAGGKSGGGASVTHDGEQFIDAFHTIQQETSRFMSTLEQHLGEDELPSLLGRLRSITMKTSARNNLRGVIEEIKPGAVNAEVIMKLGENTRLTAVITSQSVEDLQLEPGREAVALIKSSFVLLAPEGEAGKTSARNQLCGTITRLHPGAVNSEYVIDLGEGKTLVAIVTCDSAEALGLEVGDRACALIKASHIILAVD
jgi:molybdate transport system regulatory protein